MRRLLAPACAVSLLAAFAFAAGRLEPYNAGVFAAQQTKGAVIVLQFSSSGCNVCPGQQQSLERLAEEPSAPSIQFYQANYDREEELRKLYQVNAMSTLLVFRGRYLIGRCAGLFTEDEIRSFLQKTLLQERGRPRTRPKTVFGPRR